MSETVLPLSERTLQARALERTLKLVEAASAWLGTALPAPEVRFDLRGRAAGQARLVAPGPGLALPGRGRGRQASWVIRYNPMLLAANPEDFLDQTVPHEVAHLVAFARHGARIRPHGPEWQAVVRQLGGTPERCHGYDVSGSSTRRMRHFDYHCGCSNHRLSSIRHRRILAGQTYLCRRCAGALRPGSNPRLDGPAGPAKD